MESKETRENKGDTCCTQSQCGCGLKCGKLWLVLLPIAAAIGTTAWFVCC